MKTKKQKTFDEYRNNQAEYTKDKIRKSLDIVRNSSYTNVTKLAKDVASMVKEFKYRDLVSYNEKGINAPDYMSSNTTYTTLLRNSEYRRLLDIHLKEQGKAKPVVDSEDDLESNKLLILKAKNANLESQVEILKNKLIGIDDASKTLGVAHSQCDTPQNVKDTLKQLEQDRILLVDIINSLVSSTGELFFTDEKTGDLLDFKKSVVIKYPLLKEFERISKLTMGGQND